MNIYPAMHLARTFFKMFLRDRQTLMFTIVFPLTLLAALSLASGGSREPTKIGIANHAQSDLARKLVGKLSDNTNFRVTVGDEKALKSALLNGDQALVLVIPPNFNDKTVGADLRVYVDAAQVRLLQLILPTVEKALLDVERELRDEKPMFRVVLEDVKSRSQRYIDYLLPGLLAFTAMQISLAGSGFNIVEYRRKGILKRLFVTPIRPAEFIAGICVARLGWCLGQLSLLLAIAVFLLHVRIVGSYVAIYLVIVLGTVEFLCIGFCIGSLARTQQAVGAIGSIVIFPQVLLSGVFFPVEALPDMVQPVARYLPLSFVVSCLRGIANDGLTLQGIAPGLLGVTAWICVSFLLATRLFKWKEVVG